MVARSTVNKKRNYSFPEKNSPWRPKSPESGFCQKGDLRWDRAHRVKKHHDSISVLAVQTTPNPMGESVDVGHGCEGAVEQRSVGSCRVLRVEKNGEVPDAGQMGLASGGLEF
ncbi:hypothetical protein AVEN_187839-1 [Araneus ventricosus]|uniref:Uncharacterized protein n=1 Tax=Araneus ventricosus TaxID=182803 RepID=A0A4Y2CTM9_ARAVE|nr:hypothetical protein AVEN_187839-1 [Araneus ventricosus]